MKKNEKLFIDLVNRGVYKVYKNGKIYKCKRKIRFKNEYKNCEPRLMNGIVKGYILIGFTYNGKVMHILAHRAIWIFFNGDIPEGLEINHKGKSGIKSDNRLSNLELVTRSEQMIHAVNILGREIGNTKLTKKKVLRIRKLLKQELTIAYIANCFKVSMGAISSIKYGQTWAWLN